jgi:aspartyl protease family protein
LDFSRPQPSRCKPPASNTHNTMRLSAQALVLAFALPASGAHATDISVVGLFPDKAVLVIDGSAPRTYSVGAKIREGITLISASRDSATIEVNGKRETIALGDHVNRSLPSGRSSVTLQPDGRGHYVVQGQINGGSVRMLLDTGATLIALPAADALRLGIDYKKGQVITVSTANGLVPAYRVKLNNVKVGDIEITQVDALVQEHGLPLILLGMSFLNRTEMRRDGEHMVLTKRF